MAKPGQQAKAAMAGARDLSRARLTDEQVYELGATLELSQGLRCNGCGRRIVTGFHFTSLAPREEAIAIKLAACSRKDCDYALDCRPEATFMEVVEYVWLDGFGSEAPAPQSFVRAQAKAEAAGRPAANGRESRAAAS